MVLREVLRLSAKVAARLRTAKVAGRTVTCPLHSWVIGLEDGEAVAPDSGTAQPLSVRVLDGDIYIHIPELEPV